jgi:predicted ATPase
MLIAFLGSPGSGKTTIAARLFADLKDSGLPAEFLPEVARRHIVKARFENPSEPVTLDDKDQLAIFKEQFTWENMYVKASGKDSLVVTDASCLNTLLYFSEEFEFSKVDRAVKHACKHYDLVFLCEPLPDITDDDPNRIHDQQESLEIHRKLDKLVRTTPLRDLNIIRLEGNSDERLRTVQRHVFDFLRNLR